LNPAKVALGPGGGIHLVGDTVKLDAPRQDQTLDKQHHESQPGTIQSQATEQLDLSMDFLQNKAKLDVYFFS